MFAVFAVWHSSTLHGTVGRRDFGGFLATALEGLRTRFSEPSSLFLGGVGFVAFAPSRAYTLHSNKVI